MIADRHPSRALLWLLRCFFSSHQRANLQLRAVRLVLGETREQRVTDQIVRLDLANEWGVTTEF